MRFEDFWYSFVIISDRQQTIYHPTSNFFRDKIQICDLAGYDWKKLWNDVFPSFQDGVIL